MVVVCPRMTVEGSVCCRVTLGLVVPVSPLGLTSHVTLGLVPRVHNGAGCPMDPRDKPKDDMGAGCVRGWHGGGVCPRDDSRG
jgi:hypothetical protein